MSFFQNSLRQLKVINLPGVALCCSVYFISSSNFCSMSEWGELYGSFFARKRSILDLKTGWVWVYLLQSLARLQLPGPTSYWLCSPSSLPVLERKQEEAAGYCLGWVEEQAPGPGVSSSGGMTHLGDRLTKVISSFEYYKYKHNFIMRSPQCPPSLKTINIDAEIFTQASPPARSKLPLQLLKSLAERKRNKHWSSLGQRYKMGLGKNRGTSNEEGEIEVSHSSKAIELFTKKCTQKEGRGRTLSNTVCNFFPHNAHTDSDLEEAIGPKQAKQGRQSVVVRHEQSQYVLHQSASPSCTINPYTHQQYTYLTNKQQDHLHQLRKTTRFRRISSITKSYKVTTIELAPQMHQRRPSVQYSPMKTCTPTKQLVPGRVRLEVQGSPGPWEWKPEQSKDFPE